MGKQLNRYLSHDIVSSHLSSAGGNRFSKQSAALGMIRFPLPGEWWQKPGGEFSLGDMDKNV